MRTDSSTWCTRPKNKKTAMAFPESASRNFNIRGASNRVNEILRWRDQTPGQSRTPSTIRQLSQRKEWSAQATHSSKINETVDPRNRTSQLEKLRHVTLAS
jgi:hypothetical protein